MLTKIYNSMKRHFLSILCLLLLGATAQQLNARIAFSMAAEIANQNTPEGWKPVDLPQGMPTSFMAANHYCCPLQCLNVIKG